MAASSSSRTNGTLPAIRAEWTPDSWRSRPIAQNVIYKDTAKLESVVKKLSNLPPLVSPTEIMRLRSHLALVAQGKAYLLQGGDCAEAFDECRMDLIDHKLKLLLLMSLVILWGGRLPVVRIARLAGQYAKPRSKPTEVVEVEVVDSTAEGGKRIEKREVGSYRGDNVNGIGIDERDPDPDRILEAYFHSSTTLNYVRSLLRTSFASLNDPYAWSFSHVRSPELQKEFEDVVGRLQDALGFMNVIGALGSEQEGKVEGVEIFTSHEALLLEYESALTRLLPLPTSAALPSSSPTPTPSPSPSPHPGSGHPGKAYFDTSAHFVWIGDRTRQIDGAHVEFFRGLKNPVGVKVGPTMTGEELVQMLDILDPFNEPGKVTLITRYGASSIDSHLPKHIAAVQTTSHLPVWQCDPMHGNTFPSTSNSSIKTRSFASIISEILSAIQIHGQCGSTLGGIHLEMTGEVDSDGFSVTEVTGGSMGLADERLGERYLTRCDPRLNLEQSLDVAFVVADALRGKRLGKRGEGQGEGLVEMIRGRLEKREEGRRK